MKKNISLILFLFLFFQSQAQDTDSLFKVPWPDSTGFGTPDGKLTTKEIGITGGNIVSDDRRVELIFPPGALAAHITISIQPITISLFTGTGKAYRFEPSDIQFKKPVQIIFQYTRQEVESCSADLMKLAIQDHTGKWSFGNYENWDSTENKLTGFIHHFSSMSNSNGAMLRPDKKEVMVGGSVNLNFYDRYGTVQSGPFIGNKNRVSVGSRYFTVNSVTGGNELVGIALPPVGATSMGTYQAPKIMPQQNPVIVNFFFEYYSPILEKEIIICFVFLLCVCFFPTGENKISRTGICQ